MLVLILGGEKRRGQVVVAAVDHDLEPRIGLHRVGQIVG